METQNIVVLDRATVRSKYRKPDFPHVWKDYDSSSPDQVLERLKEATVAVTNKAPIREAALRLLPHLRFVAVTATGVDCVDTAVCRERGVTVSNVPAYARQSVAEHVVMLMLTLRRNLAAYRDALRIGAWQRSVHFALLDFPIRDLAGQTLGLVGYGEIGREVERLACAFGMRVIVAERKGAGSCRPGRFAFERVLKEADVLSLHLPLGPLTRGMIGSGELALMKRDAIVINTARGGIIDEAALAQALRESHLAGAAVDVLSEEPPAHGNPLLDPAIPNLLVTPHVAWSSEQAVARLAETVIQNMEAFVSGKPRNLV